MAKRKLGNDEDLDQVVEDLLDAQRKKNTKLAKQFREQNEAWQDFKGGQDREIAKLVEN